MKYALDRKPPADFERKKLEEKPPRQSVKLDFHIISFPTCQR